MTWLVGILLLWCGDGGQQSGDCAECAVREVRCEQSCAQDKDDGIQNCDSVREQGVIVTRFDSGMP